jgi:hypothetical protein
MTIQYVPKVDQRSSPYPTLTDPVHNIGTIGVNTSLPNYVKLIEVPFKVGTWPTGSTVFIPGYTEATNGPLSTFQYLVNYSTGFIQFNASQNGAPVTVTYQGTGAEVDALDVNELQGPVGLALNLDGTLSNHIVKPLSISNTPTDDFVFPNNVFVVTNLTIENNSLLTLNDASSHSISLSAPTAITANYTLKFPTAQGPSNSYMVNDGAGNLSWTTVTSITTGVQVLASDPSGLSLFPGQVWLNSTDNQFKGYNGSSIVILG